MKTTTYLKKHPSQSGHQDTNKFFRTKRFSMRMSPEEFASLEKKFLKSNENSMATFARKILSSDEKQITYNDDQIKVNLQLILNATNKIGVNLNQIARQLNNKKNEILSVGMAKNIEDSKNILLKIQQHVIKIDPTKSKKKSD